MIWEITRQIHFYPILKRCQPAPGVCECLTRWTPSPSPAGSCGWPLTEIISFVHMPIVDWAYAHDCLHFPHWIIDMLFRSMIILDHPASLSDWDISVLLPVHLIAQGPVQLIEAPGIEADRGNCIKTTFKKNFPSITIFNFFSCPTLASRSIPTLVNRVTDCYDILTVLD